MQQEHKTLPLVISLVAGLVVSIILIIRRRFSMTSVIIVLGVLLAFMILGLIFRAILNATRTKEVEEESTDEETEEIIDVTTRRNDEEDQE